MLPAEDEIPRRDQDHCNVDPLQHNSFSDCDANLNQVSFKTDSSWREHVVTVTDNPLAKNDAVLSVEKMTVWSATFTIVKSVCGTGMINTPAAFKNGGWVSGILTTLFVSAMTLWSYDTVGYIATITADEINIEDDDDEPYTWKAMWTKAFNGYLTWIPDASLLLACFGGFSFYMLLLGQFFQPCVSFIWQKASGGQPDALIGQSWYYTAAFTVVVFPMAIKEKFDSVKYISLAGFLCTCVGFFTLFIETIHSSSSQAGWNQALVADGAMFGDDFDSFRGLLSVIVFAFFAHWGACQLYKEWNVGRVTVDNKEEIKTNRSYPSRIPMPVTTAFGITTAVYTTFGFLGFLRLTNANKIPDQIFEAGPDFVYSSTNIPVLIARTLMGLSALFTLPLVAITMRGAIATLLPKKYAHFHEGNSFKWRAFCSGFVVSLATVVACVMQVSGSRGFMFVIGFSANLTGGLVMFIFPALLFIKLAPKEATRLPYYFMLAFGVMLAGVFAPWSIYDFVTKANN